MVTVTSETERKENPSILPLWPCCSPSTEDASMVTFACLLIEHGAKSFEITWEPNTPEPKKFSTQEMSGKNLFTTSQLTVSSSSFSKNPYKCSIKEKKDFPPVIFTDRYCILQPPKPVDVQILTPSCGTQSSVINVELVCFLRSLSSGKAKVEWLKNGVQLQEKEEVTLRAIVGKGSGYSSFIHLNISKESWDKGDLYTCKVTRPPGSQNVTMHNASKCQVCYGCMHQPTMSFTKPSYKSLLDRSAILVCTVISSNLENAQITWLVNGKPSSDVVDKRVTTDANGSQKLRSNHSVSLEQWTKGTVFTCKVTGSCFKEHRKEITIEKATQMNPPSVIISRAPLEISLKSTTALILICDVSGFSPVEISISWERNNMSLNKNLYDNGVATQMANGYSMYSILKINRDEPGGKGGSYCCIIHHPTSQTPYVACEKVPIDFLKPTPPRVMAFHIFEDKGYPKLVCLATSFYPKTIDIRWNTKGEKLSSIPNCSSPVSLLDGTFQKDCSLTISGEDWHNPQTYTCTVNHRETNFVIKKDVHSSGIVTSPSSMEVIKMQLPSFEELFTNRSATLTCMMSLTNTSANATFSWTMDGKPANNNSVTNEVFQETNYTSLMYGQLQVKLSEWINTTQFACSIQSGQGEMEMKHFDRRNGTMRPPKVDLQRQSSSEDFNVTLLCIAKDFYPDEIFLKWEEENQEISFKGYDTHGMKCDHEKQTCSLLSMLEVPTSKWMMGASYRCLVAHVSSENIIDRTTNFLTDSWDCTLMGAAFCDIRNENEDEYSELEEANGVWNKVFTFIILFIVAIFYGGLVTFIKVK